jgi:methyltransferase (TIGR00027 family)
MRTDGDTWTITESVGSTALFVAAARALEAQKPDPLAVDPFAEVFCRAAGGEWAEVLDYPAEGPGPRRLRSGFGDHFTSFQGARTKYFDAYFARAAADGVRQVVILAAGLDSRGYRLDWADGTVIYELDKPQVLEFKRQALGDTSPRAARREVAVDLRDDWPRALVEAGFDPSLPSAWVAEGLLIYLPAAAQQQLFDGIDRLAAPGSHVAVEEGRPMPAAAWEAKKAEERSAGEDGTFFTLVYNEQYAPADAWFGEHDWTAEPTPLTEYLDRVGRPIPADDPDAGPMAGSITLVSAIKR